MKEHPNISANPDVMLGAPCIRGTRVTVANILRQVAAGRTVEQICQDYPYLEPRSVQDALEFAADLSSGETHDLLAS